MIDIRELARLSGFSAATVSRALNDRPEVSPETRARIIELAAQLGYSPSQPARTLVRKRSDTIGLIWDTGYDAEGRRHPFLQDLLVALKVPLGAAGYHLMLLSTAGADAGVDTYLRATRQHSLDGVILMGIDDSHPAITALVDSGVACVAVDHALHGPRTTYVSSDNRTGAGTAVAHLHSVGRRRIAIITGPLNLMPASERLAGYRYQSARLGLTFRPDYVATGDFFLASGYEATRRLLDAAGAARRHFRGRRRDGDRSDARDRRRRVLRARRHRGGGLRRHRVRVAGAAGADHDRPGRSRDLHERRGSVAADHQRRRTACDPGSADDPDEADHPQFVRGEARLHGYSCSV